MSFSLINKTERQLPEKLHSKIRLVIGLCVLGLFLWLNQGPAGISFSDPNLLIVVGYILFSTTLFFAIGKKPVASTNRRSLAIFADICAATLLLIFETIKSALHGVEQHTCPGWRSSAPEIVDDGQYSEVSQIHPPKSLIQRFVQTPQSFKHSGAISEVPQISEPLQLPSPQKVYGQSAGQLM